MNSRIDQAKTSWLSEYTVNARSYRIEVITPLGRPHGIDSDTLVALETLFTNSGCPEDNWVQTTASRIRVLMGLPDNGESYHRIHQSIRRLYGTSVIVGRLSSVQMGKRSEKRASWDNIGVRFFEGLRYRDTEEAEVSSLDSEAPLGVRLGEQLADSIRAGVVQVLDGQLLHQLEQPPARVLYRVLQAHRRQDDDTLLRTLNVPLLDWRAATGLSTTRPEAIRRSLEAAHDELLAYGYLESAKFEGRGLKAIVVYVFAEEHAPDPALVMLLRTHGVSVSRASSLAAKGPERVHASVELLKGRQKLSVVRNPGGLIADFLEHPEKYELSPEFVPPPERANLARAALQHTKERDEVQAEHQLRQRHEGLKAASPAAQWHAERPALRLILKKPLSAPEWRQLEDLALGGEISAVELLSTLTAATSNGTLEQQIVSLRQRLLPLFR